MIDPETLKLLASFGTGGLLAGFMFMIYRKDMKINSDDWKGQSEILMAVVKENTAAITALIRLVEGIRVRDDNPKGNSNRSFRH